LLQNTEKSGNGQISKMLAKAFNPNRV